MSPATTWRATVTYASHTTPTDEQFEKLVGALPGWGVIEQHGDRLTLHLTIEASTLRKATDDALRAAKTAYATAFDVVGEPRAVHVLPQADHDQALAHPSAEALVGIAEIASLADVSRQRATQIVNLPDFPAPIAALAMGKVWTKVSVTAFLQRWPRKSGWAGRTKTED